MRRTLDRSAISDAGSRPPWASAAALAAAAAGMVWTWLSRARQRRTLRDLDARLMRDIGLDAEQVRRETIKPFWRA